LLIRAEEPGDAPAVREVVERAFGRSLEADLVDELRRACREGLSLVAEDDGVVVGHILFTPATVSAPNGTVTGMGLAPIAVVPARQGRGIGAALVEHGSGLLRAAGYPFIVVLGHPDYSPRFGFERASAQGLASQWEGVPDDAFMVLVLNADAMRGVSGTVEYRPEFDAAV